MIQMEMRQQKIFLLYTAQIRKYDIKHFPPGPAAYPAIAGPEIHKKVFSLVTDTKAVSETNIVHSYFHFIPLRFWHRYHLNNICRNGVLSWQYIHLFHDRPVCGRNRFLLPEE